MVLNVRRVATRTQKRSCVHIENFDKNENMENLGPMESEKTTVTSMPPYPDIFSEDFKITDEIKYDVLKKPWTTIHYYDFPVIYLHT